MIGRRPVAAHAAPRRRHDTAEVGVRPPADRLRAVRRRPAARRLERALRHAARLSARARQGRHAARVFRPLRRRARRVWRGRDRCADAHAAHRAQAWPATPSASRRCPTVGCVRIACERLARGRAASHLRRRHRARAARSGACARARSATTSRCARSTKASTTGTSPTARSTTPTASANALGISPEEVKTARGVPGPRPSRRPAAIPRGDRGALQGRDGAVRVRLPLPRPRRDAGAGRASTASPCATRRGRAYRMVGSTGDITELKERESQLAEQTAEQTAVRELLEAISRSAFDLDAVLRTLIESATRLCRAEKGFIFRLDGDVYRLAVDYGGVTPEFREFEARHPMRPGREIAGRPHRARRSRSSTSRTCSPTASTACRRRNGSGASARCSACRSCATTS